MSMEEKLYPHGLITTKLNFSSMARVSYIICTLFMEGKPLSSQNQSKLKQIQNLISLKVLNVFCKKQFKVSNL